MATITADISASATLIPVSAEVDIGYYTIDDEAIYVTGMSRGAEGRDFVRRSASVDRAVGGTTAATHTSGATLTRYYPDAAAAAGGGLPAQWTVDEFGNLFMDVAPGTFAGVNGIAGIVIRTTDIDNTNDLMMFQNEAGGNVVAIDPYGTILCTALSLSGQDFDPYIQIASPTGRSNDIITIVVNGHKRFSMNPAGEVLVKDSTGANAFKVADDGTVHIKTGGSIVADL